jgi:hypothetical protein
MGWIYFMGFQYLIVALVELKKSVSVSSIPDYEKQAQGEHL